MTLVFETGTLEYVQVAVAASEDPTEWSAYIAFTAEGGTPETWHDATWKSGTAKHKIEDRYRSCWVAQILVGPGGGDVELEAGTYEVWFKTDSGAEIPIRNVGKVEIK